MYFKYWPCLAIVIQAMHVNAEHGERVLLVAGATIRAHHMAIKETAYTTGLVW